MIAGRVSRPRAAAPYADLKVAAVVDEFSRASLAPEVQLLSLDARLWPVELALFRPDLLFVESAWRGHAGGWKQKIASYPGRRRSIRLRALVHICRRLQIPAVFWNKEDPVHYDRFIDSARLFDAVLTTAAERVADYRRDCGHQRVATMPFAVQPAIYHPTGAGRSERVVFAGSYGESHFPERRRQLELLLDGALAAGADLAIFDRNAAVEDPDKVFPERFRPHIAGARDYRALAGEYNAARIGLNVNSVTDSTTMFSRRVVEMLACGLPVVSAPGLGMSELLGDLVTTVDTADQARDACVKLLSEPDHWRRQSARGIEVIAAHHTVADRLAAVVELVL